MPLRALIRLVISVESLVVASRDEPSGRFSITCSSPWSSGGIQSRPTRRFSGTASRKVPRAMAMTALRWSSDQRRTSPYLREVQAKNGQSFPPWPALPGGERVSRRELSIGVSVKLTSMETRMAKAMVQPNWLT